MADAASGGRGRRTIRPMPSRWPRLLLLVLALIAVAAPVASAALVPDPTWIAGFYDGADGDEILLLVWDGAPAAVGSPPALCGPAATTLAPAARGETVAARLACAADSRAPPRR
jgi:hypothetical protein